MTLEMSSYADRVKGGFIGVALGDALGVPHEFSSKLPYTGILSHSFELKTRFQGSYKLAVGQYSDDTEMMLCLTRSLVENKGYDQKKVVQEYIKWAHSGTPMMGRNTRELLKGKPYAADPTGYSRYQSNFEKKFGVRPDDPFKSATDASESAQSNGALMRCFPIACLNDKNLNKALFADVWSTNPSRVALSVEVTYLTAVRMALLGYRATKIWDTIVKTADPIPEIANILAMVKNGVEWDMVYTTSPEKKTKVKGWCVVGLYAAMYCLKRIADESQSDVKDKTATYPNLIKWVINHPGSDTDTNAAIAGGLVGALVGWSGLVVDEVTKKNIGVLIASTEKGAITDVPRDERYRLTDYEKLVSGLVALKD